MSSWIGARGLPPLLEKDEEDDWVDKGATLLDQKVTLVKASPSGTSGGSLISEGHHDVHHPS